MKACDVLGPPEDVKDGNVKKMINHLILLLHNHPEREKKSSLTAVCGSHTKRVKMFIATRAEETLRWFNKLHLGSYFFGMGVMAKNNIEL